MSRTKYNKRDNLWVHPQTGVIYFRKMVNGVPITVSTKTKSMTKARMVADKLRTEIWDDNWEFAKKGKRKTSFKELVSRFLEWCEIHHKSYGSDLAYCVNLKKFFGEETLITEITTWQVEKFISERRKKVKPSTVNHELGCLKHMFRMAVEEWDLTTNDPSKKVKKLTEDAPKTRYLDDDERRILYAACAEGPWYLLPIVLIAINTGMRRGEILNLKWKDINIEKKFVRITQSKSGRSRDIPMNEILVNLFKGLEQGEDRIFPIEGFRRSWITALKTAGIQNLRFHDLRHECASQLVMSGADLRTVQEVLGHSSLIMTQRYAHISNEHKRQAMEKLGELSRDALNPDEHKVVELRKTERI